MPAIVFGKSENEYLEKWAADNGGEIRVRMPDGSQCDIVTETHAIEVEFARRWQEAIGQSLFYGLQTGKKPGIVLILQGEKDRRFLIRLNSTIRHYQLPIEVWTTLDK